MKKILLLLILLPIITCNGTLAQSLPQSIVVQKSKFYQNDRLLKPAELQSIFANNPAAYEAMRKAKGNYDAASVIGFVGGFLVGWPIGTSIGGGDPNWALAGVGAGLVLLSIPFASGYTKYATEAANIYNNSLEEKAAYRPYWRIGTTRHGLGICLKL